MAKFDLMIRKELTEMEKGRGSKTDREAAGMKRNVKNVGTSLEQMRILIRRGSAHFLGAAHALRILDLIKSDASAAAIEREAKRMPTLAASLVKLASSAAFGAMEIKSVKFAIELLGFQELYRIMMTLAMSSLSANTTTRGIFDEEVFRRRSVTTAFISEHLARQRNEPELEKYYLSGLFQDIGYLFLAIHQPVSLMHIRTASERTPDMPLNEVEVNCMGYCHSDLSAVVSEELQLPCDTILAIKHHHSPLDCPEEASTFADIACVASTVADSMGLFAVPGIQGFELDVLACARLGIDPAVIPGIEETSQEQASEVSSLMMHAA